MNMAIEMNDTVLNDLLQFLLIDTESRLYFIEGIHEILPHNLHLVNVVGNGGESTDFDMSIESEGSCTLDETTNFSTGEILRQGS